MLNIVVNNIFFSWQCKLQFLCMHCSVETCKRNKFHWTKGIPNLILELGGKCFTTVTLPIVSEWVGGQVDFCVVSAHFLFICVFSGVEYSSMLKSLP